MLTQLGARALDRDAPRLEHVRARGRGERHCRVLLDHEHGQPLLLVQPPDDAEQLGDDERREPERGLVEEEQPRREHQRAGEGEHLLLAAGERARLLREPLAEKREPGEDALEVGGDGAVAPRVRAEAEVLLDAQLDERAASLGDVRDLLPRRRLRRAPDRRPVEEDLAAAADRAGDGAEGGRLPGPVGAEDGDDLALADGERDAVEGGDRPVAGLDVPQLEQRAGHGPEAYGTVAREAGTWSRV